MRILVVGTGSIGKRHIENLLAMGAEVCFFSYRGRDLGLSDIATQVFRLDESLESDVDAVVIANRTDQHISVAICAARAGKHLYIEKPLSVCMSGVRELQQIVNEKQLVVEAGFMLRSHPNLLWIREQLSKGLLGEVWYMRGIVGQWLPDWRPTDDHRRGYAASEALGGGVTLDLIHELDLVQWLLGPVLDVTAIMRTVGVLEIQTEAIAQICLELVSGRSAQVHLDYLRPGYAREMEIVGRGGVLRWDYLQGVVTLEEPYQAPREVHRVPSGFCRNDLFTAHMLYFLRRVKSPKLAAASSLDEAVSVLKVALAARQSAKQRRHVRPTELVNP